MQADLSHETRSHSREVANKTSEHLKIAWRITTAFDTPYCSALVYSAVQNLLYETCQIQSRLFWIGKLLRLIAFMCTNFIPVRLVISFSQCQQLQLIAERPRVAALQADREPLSRRLRPDAVELLRVVRGVHHRPEEGDGHADNEDQS